MNYSNIKVVAFDAFGTVFDFSNAEKHSIGEYVKAVKSEVWHPLNLPKSWESLPAHPDSVGGIAKLRKKAMVVTLSNGPLYLLAEMSKRNGINWDAIIPIELREVCKPNDLEAYRVVPELFRCDPSECLMVTANPTFGDVESATKVGMQTAVIRNDGIANIEELAALVNP